VPAPVELTSFDAAVKSDHVKLSWATASELNNSHFVLEKSLDGKQFSKIGIVNGKGNSSSYQEYSYLDMDPYNGINYYRLKQVDYNGEFVYSKVAKVMVENIGTLQLIPNPAKNNFNIKSDQESNISAVEIYDIRGAKRMELTNSAGFKDIDISALSEGLYLIHINIGGTILVKKLVKE